MNFLRSREPDVAVVSREKRIKEGVISELSAVLKTIQANQQSRPGEPIYTCDSANNLCNAFEAVFLHGHKSAEGVNFNTSSNLSMFENCNFWSFVQRFSHKDTIHQLKRLAHIKTEVGMCRAWVKLAINDSLMESYISAMLAQPKVIKRYYNNTSLLRDLEQPDILLKLIQVLANYDFQLVYNLANLNTWNAKTLALVGFINRPFLFESAKTTATHSQRSRSSTLDMEDIPVFGSQLSYTSDDAFDQSNAKPIVDNTPNHTIVPCNTPHEGPNFTDISKSQIHDALQTLGEEEELSSAAKTDSSPSYQSTNSSQIFDNNLLIDTAAQELARLKTVHYSINDVLDQNEGNHDGEENLDTQPELMRQTEDVTVSKSPSAASLQSAASLHSVTTDSKESDTKYLSTSSSYAAFGDIANNQEDGDNSKESSSNDHNNDSNNIGDSSRNHDGGSSSHDGGTSSSHDGGTSSHDAGNTFMDVLRDYSTSPQVDFQVGTPASNCSTEPNTHKLQGKEFDDDLVDKDISDQMDDVMFQGDEEDNRVNLDDDSPYATSQPASLSPVPPLSAARAIMRKRMSGPDLTSQSNSSTCGRLSSSLEFHIKTQTSGSYVGMIQGNSLSSLTGWGLTEQDDESDTCSQSKENDYVQSFADIVSEYKQTDSEVLDVVMPSTDYTAVVREHTMLDEISKNQDDNTGPNADDKSPAKYDPEEYVIIDEVDKKCADILSHYGELCNEKGLRDQDFKCHTCSAPIGIIYGVPLVCFYTKKYFCPTCHINEEAYIPAKIIQNWDFTRYKVSRASKEFLVSAECMPLLNIQYLNSSLYDHIPELMKCKNLRTQLFYFKKYLFACSPAVADEFKQKFWPKEYIYEEIHTYSVQDLLLLNSSSSLINQMKKSIKFAKSHTQKCESCQYRGFICEICDSTQAIFPFDIDSTSQCSKCNAVYHKDCFVGDCPKCERIRRRNVVLGKSPDEMENSKSEYYYDDH